MQCAANAVQCMLVVFGCHDFQCRNFPANRYCGHVCAHGVSRLQAFNVNAAGMTCEMMLSLMACSEGMEAYTNAQIDHVNDANDINEAQLNSNLEANRQVRGHLRLGAWEGVSADCQRLCGGTNIAMRHDAVADFGRRPVLPHARSIIRVPACHCVRMHLKCCPLSTTATPCCA